MPEAFKTRRVRAMLVHVALGWAFMLVETRKIVFFDGTCNFCNAAVDFLIHRNPRHTLRYSSLQSKFAQRFFADRGMEIDLAHLDRLYYHADGKLHARSGAALRTVRELDRLWPLLSILLLIPAPIRDLLYDLVAKNRYRVFGKRQACRRPGPNEQDYFLDG